MILTRLLSAIYSRKIQSQEKKIQRKISNYQKFKIALTLIQIRNLLILTIV